MNEVQPQALKTLAASWAKPALLGVGLLLAASVASAAEAAPGLRVVKDPVTGQMRAPTAEEAAVLEGASKPTSAVRGGSRGMLTGRVNPPEIRQLDGTVQQELDDSSLNYSVATRGNGGHVDTYCVTGSKAAKAIMKGNKGVMKTAKEHDREEK